MEITSSDSQLFDAGGRFGASLSVFFPAFNDAPSLPGLLAETFETLRRVASDYEVIVVNDGSTDETARVLEQLRELYQPHLRIVTHQVNGGYGAALRSGFAAATKDYIFYTDGDGQYDPSQLETLLRAATPGAGLVNGYKIRRQDPWHRKAIGWLYNHFARFLFRIKLRDIDCDFRLIQRRVLNPAALRSTSGTICVELVRQIELSGAEVVEVPVEHYPRLHGRSQFFRIKSLAVTFVELCAAYLQFVIQPALIRRSAGDQDPAPARFSPMAIAITLAAIAGLSWLAYAPALRLPFIADDYIQIGLARVYGPMSGWAALAGDALYRCRATSLILTYWLDRAVGLDPFYYYLTSILLHIVNGALVFALGIWRPVGWPLAALAAGFFAVSQRHSEAVVWFSAVPELLVFLFAMASLLCWIHWIQSPRRTAIPFLGAFLLYGLALLSKESAVAVIPLAALVAIFHGQRVFRNLLALTPFAATGVAYFVLIYGARESHLHFHDGTFSLNGPFFQVLLRSSVNLLWLWGVPAMLFLVVASARPMRRIIPLGSLWIALALFPYSFLTYMLRVPSRHTYLASAGLALIVGAGLLALWRRTAGSSIWWIVPLLAAAIVGEESGYLWLVKHSDYARRAEPTEALIEAAREADGPVYASCFPYSPSIAEYALALRSIDVTKVKLVVGPEAAVRPDAANFCNDTADGVHHEPLPSGPVLASPPY